MLLLRESDAKAPGGPAFEADESRSILGDMKASYGLSFLCGAAVMLGFDTLR
jgi:hypothetical protein